LQISLGAPILVKPPPGRWDPAEIARLEFKKGLIPMTIKRKLPTGEEVVIDIKKAIENWLKEHGGEL
jgi:DNA-directed RNA polymerase subunit K/omega